MKEIDALLEKIDGDPKETKAAIIDLATSLLKKHRDSLGAWESRTLPAR